ncbi:hypothetical protein [Klebsiella michiganensis]|uniref:hypothetical protein n=1 Tax=Klebsiella michiganensis TaxID=1134687 RepID=UPI001E3C4714|nr:hypothetical protein [Klebsiella michiganensis]
MAGNLAWNSSSACSRVIAVVTKLLPATGDAISVGKVDQRFLAVKATRGYLIQLHGFKQTHFFQAAVEIEF